MADLLDFGGVRVLTSNAAPGAGYVARFYESGTTTPKIVYTDSTLGTAHGTSVTADAAGVFAAVWSSGGAIKCVIETDAGAVVQTIDPVISVSATSSGAEDISFTPTVDLPFTNVQDAIEGAAASAASGFSAYGIGITGNATLLANLDATNIGAGAYRFDNTTTGTYPTGVAAADTGLIEHWRQAAGTAMQVLYHATSDRVFHRRMAAAAWGTWRENIEVNQCAAEGDLPYRAASAWTRLAKGTALQVLRMNSGATAPEWASEGTALASWTYSSNVTSIPLTGLSGWDSVVVTGFLTVSANVQLRVSPDNGSTWRSTNYVWRVLDEGGGTDPTDGMDLCRIGSGSIQFDLTLQRMSQAARSTYASGNARHGNPRMNTFAGIHNVSEVINAVQIVGATISAGFVEVFGIRRA